MVVLAAKGGILVRKGERLRKRIADEVRDELLQLPEVNQVDFLGDREFEISIEVSELTLRQYGLIS